MKLYAERDGDRRIIDEEVEGFEVAEAIVNYPNWPEGCDAILVGDTGQEWLLTSDWEEFTSE